MQIGRRAVRIEGARRTPVTDSVVTTRVQLVQIAERPRLVTQPRRLGRVSEAPAAPTESVVTTRVQLVADTGLRQRRGQARFTRTGQRTPVVDSVVTTRIRLIVDKQCRQRRGQAGSSRGARRVDLVARQARVHVVADPAHRQRRGAIYIGQPRTQDVPVVVVGAVALTLHTRSRALALPGGRNSLTVRRRNRSFTLPDR